MSKKALKGAITISKPTYGSGEKWIVITLNDERAGIQFLEVRVDYANFAEALTGLSLVGCEFDVRGLQNVGKKAERDTLRFEVPKNTYSRKSGLLRELADKALPEGWSCSYYFNSQDSFYEKDGKRWAQTSIRRWVEDET